MYIQLFNLHFVSFPSIESNLWCEFFSNSAVMNATEQIHNKSKKIFLECLCHGFEPSLCEMDECVDVPAIFVNVDSLSAELKYACNYISILNELKFFKRIKASYLTFSRRPFGGHSFGKCTWMESASFVSILSTFSSCSS